MSQHEEARRAGSRRASELHSGKLEYSEHSQSRVTTQAHFTEAWRAVATARIDEFIYQCERLGALAGDGIVDRAEAADCLTDIAEAHSFSAVFGTNYIFKIIADAFMPPAVQAEAAE